MSCRIYLAGECETYLKDAETQKFDRAIAARTNRLKSYAYVTEPAFETPCEFKSYMLDSGAFTFLYGEQANRRNLVYWEYAEKYASYVKQENISLFMELDIDALVGYDEVKKLRKRIERDAGRPCIPVWHRERGVEEYRRMCDEYEYVAIGGMAGRLFKNIGGSLAMLVKEAHQRGAKVHGLGYARLEKLERIGFDSVDATSWLYGNKVGFMYVWRGGTMEKVFCPKGKKLVTREVVRHNFMEWVKASEYWEAR